MTPDALIFDLDGTLWDAAAASAYGWNLALDELGLSRRVTVDGIRSVSGRPFPQCVETLLPELFPAPASTLELLEARERTGIELMAGVLYDGVADGLSRLDGRYPLFLVSNCPELVPGGILPGHRPAGPLHRLGLPRFIGDRQIRDAPEPGRDSPLGACRLRGRYPG